MYKSTVNHIKDHIAFYSRHNFLLHRQIGKIRDLDKMTQEELLRVRDKQAVSIIRHAATASSFYKDLYSGIDLSGSFQEIYASLPVLQKAEVKANGYNLLTTSARFLKKAHTSGTSGSPLAVYRPASAILTENAYVWYYRSSHGLDLGDPVVSMRTTLNNKTLQYQNKAENILHLSSYQLSKTNIKKYAKLLKSFQPKAICAFPSSVYTLVDLLEQEGIDVKVPLIFTSSETLYPFQRAKIEKALGAKIFDWYGNAERSIALGQCEEGNYHEMPLYSINDFSERGVLTTSLINKAFPLIKYYVDDIFKLKNGDCACGRRNAISSLEGRVDDVLVLDDGARVSRLGIVFQNVNHVRYAQIIQYHPGAIEVNIVANAGFGESERGLLEQRFRQRLNDRVTILFRNVQEKDIIKTKAGKFKLIVSKLGAGATAPVAR
jgi:phenylacetate-CoA ligase